jgi:hypothetical protein
MRCVSPYGKSRADLDLRGVVGEGVAAQILNGPDHADNLHVVSSHSWLYLAKDGYTSVRRRSVPRKQSR